MENGGSMQIKGWQYRNREELHLLIGVRKIIRYMGISAKTFYAWVKQYGFPASRLPDGRWVTSPTLIDGWVGSLRKAQTDRTKGAGTGMISV